MGLELVLLRLTLGVPVMPTLPEMGIAAVLVIFALTLPVIVPVPCKVVGTGFADVLTTVTDDVPGAAGAAPVVRIQKAITITLKHRAVDNILLRLVMASLLLRTTSEPLSSHSVLLSPPWQWMPNYFCVIFV
jgi:hypothetical protein